MAKQANKHLTLQQIDFYTPKSDKTIQKKRFFALCEERTSRTLE